MFQVSRRKLPDDPSALVVGVEPSGDGDEVTVLAIGDIDLRTAGEFAAVLADSLRRNPSVLCVDLTKVRFLGAACLSALVAARNEARLREVSWRVLIPELAAVRRVFAVTGLLEVLAVEVQH